MAHPRGALPPQIDDVGESEWNSLLDGFCDANVYQSWAYGAVCWGERQLSHVVLRRDGAPVALAQLRIVRVPLLGAGVAYLRWGPVCVPKGSAQDPLRWRSAAEALVQEYVVRRRLLLRVVPNIFQEDPAAGDVRAALQDLGFTQDTSVRSYQTLRVDLTRSVDAMRQGLSSRWRRQLNIAERNQLDVVEGQSDDLYQQFLGLYRQMMARKQFETTVDPTEFRRIQARLPDAQKMMTLICRAAGKAVAGLVVACVGDTAIYLLAATGDDGLDSRGSYLLQWRAMQKLKESGVRWYDLGGVNPERNPGVFTFKSGMGGEPASQVGRFDLGRSRLSRASVVLGEGMSRMLRGVSRGR